LSAQVDDLEQSIANNVIDVGTYENEIASLKEQLVTSAVSFDLLEAKYVKSVDIIGHHERDWDETKAKHAKALEVARNGYQTLRAQRDASFVLNETLSAQPAELQALAKAQA
jgi:non-ribosomal peptide synthetase component F